MIEQYKKLRTQDDMPVSWFHDYFTRESGKQIDFNSFYMMFMSGDISKVLEYLDKKFNLTVVLSKEGRVIKVL